MKRYVPFLILVLAVFILLAGLRRPNGDSEFDLNGFAQLPTLVNGRIKPMDTVARTNLLIFQGRQKVKNADGENVPTTAWLLDVFFRSEIADTYQHFEIVHPGILEIFKLTTADGDGKKRFSFIQLQSGLAEVDRQAKLADEVESAQRSAFQRAAVQTRNRLITYQQIKHSLILPDGRDFLGQLHRLQDEIEPGIAAVRARSNGEPHDEELAERIIDAGQVFLRLDQVASLLPIPPLGEDTSDQAWQKTGKSLLESFQTGMVNPYALTYAGLAQAWREQDPEKFNTIVRLFSDQLQNRYSAQLSKAGTETRFNEAEPFYRSSILYVLVFLLAILSWLRWPEPLQRGAYYVMTLAFVATTAGIITRMWLEGRPPVTNLYSSALFVGWGAVGLCLILERIFRNGIGTTAGGLVGFGTLLIAHHLSLSGDTLEMMRAVLDSNFWLATHVIIITIGYSATFLSGFLAILYVFFGLLFKVFDKDTIKSLERMVYGIVCFATLFSLVGTILGGIWADQSWGRFWGWDPKENGALLIVIWNAVILHARWGGLARTRGIMALAIFGNIVTSWSWFGTNMLGVGLHSYGFMDQAFYALVIFILANLCIIGIAYLPSKLWRSAPVPNKS